MKENRFKKNQWKKGAALVFTFMLLILFAAFSLSMFEVSKATQNLSGAVVEVKNTRYIAEAGMGYFLNEINRRHMAGENIDSQVLPWLQSQVDSPKNFGEKKGWFALESVAKSGQSDYLLTIRGWTASSLSLATSKLLGGFVDMAFAQVDAEFKYQVLFGPEVEGAGGNSLYTDTSSPDKIEIDVNNTPFSSYPGSNGGLVTQDPGVIPDSALAPNMSKYTLTSNKITQIQNTADQMVNDANALVVNSPDMTGAQTSSSSVPSAVLTSWDSGEMATLPEGNYDLSGSDLKLDNTAIGTIGTLDGSTFTNLQAAKLEVKNGAKLNMGPGNYSFSGDVQIDNNTYATIGDPTGTQFTSLKADKLEVKNNSTLVLGPGVYSFSEIEVENNATLILDTTNGPVYITNGTSGGGGEMEVENAGRVLVFKDNSSVSSSYSSKIDGSKQWTPLGSGGQKVGMILFGQNAELEVENHAMLGGFAAGNQGLLYSGILDLTSSNSELSSNTDVGLNTSSPTAGTLQIWGKTGGGDGAELKFKNNSTTTASMVFGTVEEAELENHATINGLLAMPQVTDKFEVEDTPSYNGDPNLSPFPPQVVPGSYHVKMFRRVQ